MRPNRILVLFACSTGKKYITSLGLQLFLLFVFSIPAFSTIRLPAIFSDHLVIQQKSKVLLWGWGRPGEKIVLYNGWSKKNVSTITGTDGQWSAMLNTPVAGGPYTIKITGENTIELKDVLIGEVWICSGQSNMVFSLKSSDNAKEEIEKADYPDIRYFEVKRQYGRKAFDDAAGSVWEKTSPQKAPSFSAVAYYFAKKIHKELKVPVGIVYAAWGGTPAEAWTPEAVLKNDPVLSAYIGRWETIQKNVGKDSVAYHAALSEWKKDSTASKKPVEPQTLYYYKRPWREPGVLFNGMINPIIFYSIKGVLWYQGESNVSYADEYDRLFSAMIRSWREKWNEKNNPKVFPFYFVQIAPFKYSDLDAAARLRRAQHEVANKVPQAGMVATIDLGNMGDIHYTRKKEVGERLALIALNKTYGLKDLEFSGPALKKACLDGAGMTGTDGDKVEQAVNEQGKVHLCFDQKLFTTNNQKAGGFEIGYKEAGSDSLLFVKAESIIKNNEVIVWNAKAQKPVMIRYAWLEIGEANLINDAGLPALPFAKEIK